MVSHDGGDYLPRTLAALSDQTRPADAVIGVDTGSRDDSAALLERAFGKANVTTFQQGKSGMGEAVMAGLAALAPLGSRTGRLGRRVDLAAARRRRTGARKPSPNCCRPWSAHLR